MRTVKRLGFPQERFPQDKVLPKEFRVYQIWIMRSARYWTASAHRIPPGHTHSR